MVIIIMCIYIYIHTQNGMLFNLKQEGNFDTHHNIDNTFNDIILSEINKLQKANIV